MKGAFLGWFGACRAGTRDFCSSLATLVSPVQIGTICVPSHCALFQFFVLVGQQAGQAAALGRLSLSMCLWVFPRPGLL
jgi:hypothetical protein